ncbi:MAG TPA: hypothetical protein VKY41_06060 [Xanthomarina sp.]|nr:hypothetical protein [Xanthomarina sp.]
MKSNPSNILSFCLLLLTLITFNNSIAQSNDVQLFSNTSRTAVNTSNTELKEYVYEYKESGYYTNGRLTFSEENYKRLYTDVASLATLNNLDLSNVESIIINVNSLNDLNARINYLDAFSNLSNLKCVYINCEIQASKQQVENMFSNVPSSNILNYYGVNIPR